MRCLSFLFVGCCRREPTSFLFAACALLRTWQAQVVNDADASRAERWTSTVVLGDGDTAVIRPIRPGDAEALNQFHLRQSAQSRYMRFFSPKPSLSDKSLERFTNVDFVHRVAFVVETHGEFVAWASYEQWQQRDDAEVAFMVDDKHQGLGIATLLLEHLAVAARSNGIRRFTAQTLGENRAMLNVFVKAGWPVQRRFDSGVIDIDFPLDDTAEFIDSVERREQRADSRAIARILLPTSIAVIGASDEQGSIGHTVWRNVSSDPNRPTYPVNPRHGSVGGVPTFASVLDIVEEVGLAIIAVPVALLAETIDECIAKRVRGAVVITAPHDPRVDGAEGVDIEALVMHARHNGLRIIGPASMGIASTLPDVALQAALVEVTSPPGGIAISMQSGTLGGSLLRLAGALELGLSWFVSLGDKSDVSSNDLLQFWEDDQATKVIALYTESVGNGRKFARIARRVALTRPIVVVRTGAALVGAGSDAMYRQSGVIEVPTVPALLDTARVLASQPLMHGNRVAVLSNARSPSVAVSATLTAAGLTVVDPPIPIDWRTSADGYRLAITAALDAADVHALVVVHAPPTEFSLHVQTSAIDAATRGAVKPVVAVMLGLGDGPLCAGSAVPSFAFPEQASAALARVRWYSEWREAELAGESETSPHGLDRVAATRIIDEHVLAPGPVLNPEVVRQLLGTYGIAMPPTMLVNADAAVDAADQLGYPVAIKALQRGVGRSVEAGVALDVVEANNVRASVITMREHLGDGAARVFVQHMVPPGVDLRVRVTLDPTIGPIVTVGLGGSQADLIGDASSRLAPVSPSSARAMIADTKAASTLNDERDLDAVVDLVVRMAQLASDHAEIVEFDLNPVLVRDGVSWVVDAQLTLEPVTRPERAVRRLESD